MSTVFASYFRDNNRVPITTDGVISTDTQVLTGNNTTVHVPLFTITGTIEVRGLWGVVTTVLGSNNTAAYFRLNDGTNTPAVTLATGTTLSAAPVGSTIAKKGLATAAVALMSSAASVVSEPTTLETTYFSPFVAVQLTAGTTNLEFTYTTTNTPTTGAIQFFMRWLPISQGANVKAL